MARGIHLRLPYQSDPETRKRINAGEMDYMDIHLSHLAQHVEYGFLGMHAHYLQTGRMFERGNAQPLVPHP